MTVTRSKAKKAPSKKTKTDPVQLRLKLEPAPEPIAEIPPAPLPDLEPVQVARDAGTGKFVSFFYAAKHKLTTIIQTVFRRKS